MSGNRPSMRDFDYFSSEAKPLSSEQREELDLDGDEVAATVEMRVADFHARQRRELRVMVLVAACFGAMAWFAAGHRDGFVYAFAASQPPKPMGNVDTIAPEQLIHNDYVSIRGVTEHRGMQLKVVRGLGFSRQEYWYFRLLGSRGVFIEVEPDADKYGYITQVDVAGRVVDPARSDVYSRLVDEYVKKFHPREREHFRVVQVGLQPGEGKLPYFIGIAVLTLISLVNIVVLYRHLRRRRPV
jgi:hypothetical protein